MAMKFLNWIKVWEILKTFKKRFEKKNEKP